MICKLEKSSLGLLIPKHFEKRFGKKQTIIHMKYLFFFSLFFLSLGTSAQDSKTMLMKVVLTDSIVNKYMVNLGGVDSDVYKLFHKSGNYLFNNGTVEFEEHNCENNNSIYKQYGIIKKIKIKKSKATVKIHFSSNNNTRVRLQQYSNNWKIKSWLIFRSWKYPKDQTQIVYYKFQS